MKTTKVLVFASLFLTAGLVFAGGASAAVFYVKAGAAGGGNGSSWGKAFSNLDLALNASRATPTSDQIWIAKGTYVPSIQYGSGYTGNEPNLVTFNLPSNVTLYGGFVGNEKSLSDRNGLTNPTILSGDLNGDDINTPSNTQTNKSDNAWHVLTADGVTGVVLDSLIVRNGYASGPDAGATSGRPQFNLVSLDYAHAAGGGLLARDAAKVTLNSMRFEYNGSERTSRVTVVTNPLLGGPAAATGGAAVAAIEDTIVTISNSTFDRNNAYGFGANGGALNSMLEASFNVNTSTFTNNSANRMGGAIRGKNGEFINVVSSFFQNNVVTGGFGDESGGAIGAINTNLSVSKSSFDANVSGPLAGGGAIFFHQPLDDGESYTLTVASSTFTNNVAALIGGGAINISGVASHPGTNAKISSSSFNNNRAGDGGAMYIDAIPTVISNSTFNGNQAGFSGGAIFASTFGDAALASTLIDLADRPPLTISNSSFANNSIVGLDPGPTALDVFKAFATGVSFIFASGGGDVTSMSPGGGAIASEFAGNVTISNCSFTSNSAPNASGGAFLIGGAVGTPAAMGQAYLKVSNSTCSGNTAGQGNNSWLIDAMELGASKNGVLYVQTDGGNCE